MAGETRTTRNPLSDAEQEIARLRAENERLRAALREAVPYLESIGAQYVERSGNPLWIHQVIARAVAALKEVKHEAV